MAQVETEVKERPILFSGAMVQAILEGRKTQTRRVMKPQPSHDQYHEHAGKVTYDGENRMWCWKDLVLENIWDFPDGNDRKKLAERCPYGKPGDRLWVRETLGVVANWGTIHYVADDAVCYGPEDQKSGFPFAAEAEAIIDKYGDAYFANEQKCVPSIFMPRWASRITLEIKSVRVERIQDISGHDCLDEGIPPQGGNSSDGEFRLQAKFRELWDSVNAKRGYGWDKNPWCWVIEFELA